MEVVAYEIPDWGIGELWLEADQLVYHELPEARDSSGTKREHPLATRIAEYFGGKRVEFGDVPLELEWCTPFQRAVAEALRRVPYGETVTYGELAALAGHANAQRAAGTFCAENRFPLVLPCHRVVSAGGIGSYGSLGAEYKRRLLGLEGVVAFL
jgi:O-6-methylguanine DNA methyltransferase